MNTHILMDHLTLFYTTNIIQRINPRHEYHNYHLYFTLDSFNQTFN